MPALLSQKSLRPVGLRVVFSLGSLRRIVLQSARKTRRFACSRPIPRRSRSPIVRLHLLPYLHRRTDDASHKNRLSRVHRLPRGQLFHLHCFRSHTKFHGLQRHQRKSSRPASRPELQSPLDFARPHLYAMAQGISRVHQVCESRRSASRARNLRRRRLPRQGSPRLFDQHDDPHRSSVGCGALQQRRLSYKKHAFRRKLRSRRQAASHQIFSASRARGDPRQRRAPRA